MLTNLVISLGLTRDSATWFWSRVVSGATLIVAIVISGNHLLDPYLSDHTQKALVVVAAVVLWLAGKFDSSPLPGGKP